MTTLEMCQQVLIPMLNEGSFTFGFFFGIVIVFLGVILFRQN